MIKIPKNSVVFQITFHCMTSFGAGDVEIAVSTFPEAFYISIAEVGHSEQTHTKTPWGQLIRTTTTTNNTTINKRFMGTLVYSFNTQSYAKVTNQLVLNILILLTCKICS